MFKEKKNCPIYRLHPASSDQVYGVCDGEVWWHSAELHQSGGAAAIRWGRPGRRECRVPKSGNSETLAQSLRKEVSHAPDTCMCSITEVVFWNDFKICAEHFIHFFLKWLTCLIWYFQVQVWLHKWASTEANAARRRGERRDDQCSCPGHLGKGVW